VPQIFGLAFTAGVPAARQWRLPLLAEQLAIRSPERKLSSFF
jgi:hypothetical protein